MRKPFYETPVVQWCTKVSYIIWMNVLWFFCCLPVVTAGAATAALYRMLMNLREEKKCSFIEYFKAFAANFKNSTLIWLILLGCIALLLGFYYGIALCENEILRGALLMLFVIAFFLVFITLVYVFPVTCYFENTVGNTLKNAVAMGASNLKATIPACALTMIPVLGAIFSLELFLRMLVMWILFAPGLIGYGVIVFLTPVLEKYAGIAPEQPSELE